MMKRSALIFCGVLLMLSVLCSSCKSRNASKHANEASSELGGKDSTEVVSESSMISSVSALHEDNSTQSILYLDGSRSMAGYMESKNSSVFNNVIAGLLYRTEASTAHLFDLQEQKEIGKEDFINMMNNRRIRWSSESNLGMIIKAMANNFTSGRAAISYLITDGIMSGTDEQIRTDREYNKPHYGHLQEEIESELKKCGSDASVLVVRYISGFTTNPSKQFYYYCYDNSHVELDNAQRPFFIIALGSLDSIKALRKDIQENTRLSTYTNLLLLGDNMPYKVEFRPAYNRGASMRDEGIYTIDKNVKSSDLVFLNINLSPLQDYMINTEYITKNGFLFSKSGNSASFEVSKGNYEISLVNSILTIGIQSEKLRGATLSYKIKYNLPDWVYFASSSDDKNVSNDISPKTFNLKYFIEALAVVNKPHISSDGFINQTEDIKFK